MEQLFPDFLFILKNALQGTRLSSFKTLPEDQWKELAALAGKHKVVPLFYDTIRLLPQLQGTELLALLRHQSRQQIVLQTRKSFGFLAVYEALQQAGATPLVVKGILCRNLYPQPDLRPSSDEDLLIQPCQLPLCHEVLTRQGLRTNASEQAHEIPYRRPDGMLFIELHQSLFPPESKAYGDLNRFFDGVFRRAIPVEIQGSTLYTMSHTDHLFYLICHAFKHFLHSGFGIRQVCDIALYANAYGSQIDWLRILENCRQTRTEKFAAALFQIGSRHLVFDPDKACYPDPWRQIRVDEAPMLADLLSGGIYGGADMNRRHSSNITLDAAAAQKQGRKIRNGTLASAFPPAAMLEHRYPYLKKHPYLLPVAWCSRILTYSREAGQSRDLGAADTIRIGSERIRLLKEYGILES